MLAWLRFRFSVIPALCRGCSQPMRYSLISDMWECSVCRHSISRETLIDYPRLWTWRHVWGL